MIKTCSILLLSTALFASPVPRAFAFSPAVSVQSSKADQVIFQATFAGGEEQFTVEGVPTGRPIWKHSADGFMNADAANLVQEMTSFYLVSPAIRLSGVGNSVSFEELGSYFKNNWQREAQLVIRELDGDWTVIDREYPTTDLASATPTEEIYIPSAFDGKTVQIAFKYSSDGHRHSGIWHVRNLVVRSCAHKKQEAELAFATDYCKFYLDSELDFESPELVNPHQLTVNYTSSRPEVATVDPVSGKIAVLAEGKTTITAKSAENADFRAGEAAYVLDVYDAQQGEFARPELRSPIVAVEFTGQRCRYCPNMSRGLADNQDRYGKENYIIAALHHLTEYSLLPAKFVSLYNEEAVHYAESMQIHEGLPHMGHNTLGTEMSDLTLEEQFKEADLLECTGAVAYTTDREYIIQLKTRLRRDQQQAKNKRVDVLFWALENGIVAFQDDNGKQTYPEHNHVFRGSLNSTWGEAYTLGTSYAQTWKAPAGVSEIENTEIVALFLEHDSRKILDAASFVVHPYDATGIAPILPSAAHDNVIYDLSGRRVQAEGLSHGIYIKNGKKVMVK